MLDLLGIFASGTVFLLILTLPTAPRGKRWVVLIVLPAAVAIMLTVLFGGAWLGNHLIFSILYGPGPAWTGQIAIVESNRDHLLLSNGDEFRGLQKNLWTFGLFVTTASVGTIVLRLGRFLTTRSPRLRWFMRELKNLRTQTRNKTPH